MPSPFPGMDPYLENPIEWPDTHHGLISEIRTSLAEKVAPNYIVRVEQRVYISSIEDMLRQAAVPDVFLVERPDPGEYTATATLISPATRIEPLFDLEQRLRFIEILDARSREVITTLELLSPANKAQETPGRTQFLEKRNKIMASSTHWLEIDLLRAGERPDEMAGLSDYYALLKRGNGSSSYEVWFTDLRDRLPVVAVPLRPEHGDVPLDLQATLDALYQHAHYANAIDYSRPVPSPALRPADANWVAAQIRSSKQSRPD